MESYFEQYVPKKHKCFGIKIYKLCNMTEYTYNMRIYLGKEKQNSTDDNSYTCDWEVWTGE
jgi:hypothetical protein